GGRLQSFCASSWSRRSSLACPRSLNDAFIIATARSAMSWSLVVAQPAAIAAIATATEVAFFIAVPLSLDGWRVKGGAIRVMRQECRKRDRAFGGELQFGKALLPI